MGNEPQPSRSGWYMVTIRKKVENIEMLNKDSVEFSNSAEF